MNYVPSLLVAAIVFGLASSNVRAETSCSEWRATCKGTLINKHKDPKLCDESWNKCMKTGHWLGPDTGTDYGAASKR
jgi:hypothetical protein